MQQKAFHYAGFWSRFLATVLDVFILSLVSVLFGFSFISVDFGNPGLTDFQGQWMTFILPIAFTLLFWEVKSATPGKIIMGLKIVDADTGGKPMLGKLILRYFAYYVSALPLLLGFFWVAFDSKKQGFHDKLARTLVVREEESEAAEEPVHV